MLKDTQLGSYILECLLANYCMFVIALSLKNYDVTLWYYDSISALRSIPFNFLHDPRCLILVLHCMNEASSAQAGFSPFIAGATIPGGRPWVWKGQRLKFMNSGSLLHTFIVTDDPLFISRQMQGRCTFILPVKPADKKAPKREMVLKFLWLDRDRSPEIVLINEIHTAAPELQEYLPWIFFDRFYNSEMDLHLPHFNLNIQFNKLKMHDLTVIIAESCCELWMVDSLEEFKTAFMNIFECHHRAFVKGRILHGAIASRNIMFYRRNDTSVVSSLHGFDDSFHVDDMDMVIPSEALHRPCISLFMATDLLDITVETPHRYCHDLESFFYVLLWARVHFDLKNHKEKPMDELFALWDVHTEADFIKAHDNKSELWHNDGRLSGFKSRFTEDFISLWDEWVTPLRELFYDAREEEKRIRAQTPDQETLNSILTFEIFMEALGREPRT
ncbi:uncharacterized protein ARMOST_04153 [Armillaria ostoyae]|uniref:Fungal-type protein kinase domain-containing protein n=1 Tax=Armillaria ostoyae TaxID=47428 RepID=A0A284QWN3_ARMOS|nr:uncharacterized protein ARMOST_04153 [Armillaria ostoyae]